MARPSLLRFGILLSLSLALISAVAVGGFYLLAPKPSTEVPPENVQRPIMASQIEFLATSMRRLAERIANHPQTMACFETRDPDICRAQAANLHALNQEASTLFVTAGNGSSQQLLPGFVPGDASQLIDNASRNSSSMSASVFSLSASQPVVDSNGNRLGFVIVEQPVPEVQTLFDKLPLPDSGAYAELQQQSGNGDTTVLMRRGNQNTRGNRIPTTLLTLAGTPWKIAVWKNSESPLLQAMPYIMAWLVIFLTTAILVAGVITNIRNRVIDNLKVIVGLANDLRLQRLKADYPSSLAEFEGPMRNLLKLGRQLAGKQKEVSTQARLDHLSKVHNRLSFEEKQGELFKTLKDGWTHSLLILDIDNFKQINDTFGHEAGDQMIVAFGKALRDNLRNSDFIARLGGDEFCVIFPYTPLDRAEELAGRLRDKMPDTVELIHGVTHKLSWSGGLSEYSKNDAAESAALARADAALLEAKRAGRNNTRITAAA
ncbi:MAG: GGDEF domain-containing protein [Thiobacillaceae bacterium]